MTASSSRRARRGREWADRSCPRVWQRAVAGLGTGRRRLAGRSRPSSPEEIAATLRFLCSDDAAAINGARIPLDWPVVAAESAKRKLASTVGGARRLTGRAGGRTHARREVIDRRSLTAKAPKVLWDDHLAESRAREPKAESRPPAEPVDGKGVAELGHDARAIDAGTLIQVPAGPLHKVVNTGLTDRRLYTVYAPPAHDPGTIHRTMAEAVLDDADQPAVGATT